MLFFYRMVFWAEKTARQRPGEGNVLGAFRSNKKASGWREVSKGETIRKR